MTKIAICFFGQVKNYNNILYESFICHVLESLSTKSTQFDYFLVTYKNTHYINPKHNEDHSIDYTSIFKYFKWVDKILIDPFSENIVELDHYSQFLVATYGTRWHKSFDAILATKYSIRQLYGLHLLYNILKNKYDQYIFLRADAQFNSKLYKDWDDAVDISIPNFASYTGYNDRFAVILNENALRSYCSRYIELKNYPQQYQSENYLKQILNKNNLNIYLTNSIKFNLLRANNKLTSDKY
jgi:hypothetical protein